MSTAACKRRSGSSLRNSSRSAMRSAPSTSPDCCSKWRRRACASKLRGAISASKWRRISMAPRRILQPLLGQLCALERHFDGRVAVSVLLSALQDVVEQRPIAARARQLAERLQRFAIGRAALEHFAPGLARAHRRRPIYRRRCERSASTPRRRRPPFAAPAPTPSPRPASARAARTAAPASLAPCRHSCRAGRSRSRRSAACPASPCLS